MKHYVLEVSIASTQESIKPLQKMTEKKDFSATTIFGQMEYQLKMHLAQ
jgi:hypothetical protein